MLKLISSLLISIALVNANEASEDILLNEALSSMQDSLKKFEETKKGKVDEQLLNSVVNFIDNNLIEAKDSYQLKKDFSNLHSIFNNFYQDFNFENKFNSMLQKNFSTQGFTPKINMKEDNEAYYIDIDLPGISKDEIDIKITNNILTISGERKKQKDIKERDYYKMESIYGKFQRSFTLSNDANASSIKASSKDGVLELRIDKLKASPQKIEIN